MKHLREREDKAQNENKEPCKSNEAMKAEVFLLKDAVEESMSVENKNHALKKRVLELENEQKEKESNGEQLKKAADVKKEEMKNRKKSIKSL